MALNISGGQINFENSTIQDVGTGLQVSSGSVVYRGSILNVTSKGIYSCNWMFSCNVDAAYADWGSADGPLPASGSLVCGNVTINPWTHGGSEYSNHNIFAIPQCDSTATPSDALNARISRYQAVISNYQAECDANMQDACNAITTTEACIQGAWDVAQNNAPFSFPTGSPISNPSGYTSSFLGAASDYIESLEPGAVSGMTFAAGSALIDSYSLISNLNAAYDSCLNS